MSKKVLIISSTPRKGGNSDVLCDQFKKGAEEGGHSVEKVTLRDKDIKFCVGCYACHKTGKCFQNDSVSDILNKMVEADTIVMATPVYFYTMDGQMKTLIDRTLPRYLEINNKDFYFIITAADGRKGSLTRTLEGFRGYMDCFDGSKERGVIFGTGVHNIGEVQSTKHMKDTFHMGKEV